MIPQQRRDRHKKLDRLLRSGGVHIKTVAKRWGVQSDTVYEDLRYLKSQNGEIKRSKQSDGKSKRWVYYYAFVLQTQQSDNFTSARGTDGNKKPFEYLPMNCVICKTTFTPIRLTQQSCSIECRKALKRITWLRNQHQRRARLKELRKPRPCPVCGTPFIASQAHTATCSTECQRIRRRAGIREFQRKASIKPPTKCPICGKQFVPTRERRVSCSEECQKRRNRLSQRPSEIASAKRRQQAREARQATR